MLTDQSPESSSTIGVVNVEADILREEVDRLADALTVKFEELTLLHGLTERLKLEEDPASVCEALLVDLSPCISAETLAIDLAEDRDLEYEAQNFQSGKVCDREWLHSIAIEAIDKATDLIANSDTKTVTIDNHFAFESTVLRVVVVPIVRQNVFLGYMLAVRSSDDPEFGTVEADLMRSTSMMLGAHLINQRQYLEIQQMFQGTIQSLVSALDAKDAYTCGHSSRVAEMAVTLAERLGFDEERIATIRMAGILHDVGKIGVEDSVLQKPGKLTESEFDKIKQHPVLGHDILQGIRPFRKILPAVRHHHESWDGTGYPDGLAGESIPRDAQLLAVADAFDAMISDRPYRKGMPLERVVKIFEEGRGSQWAADVVDILLDSPELMEEYALRDDDATTA